MKILLIAINAKYIHSNPAVYSLQACAGAYASHVKIIEFTINQPVSYMLREIYKERPDVAAFSCYIWNRSIIAQLVPDLKKLLPGTDLWAGGPEVSYDAAKAIENWQLRGVMRGHGESSFYRLAMSYATGGAGSLPAILDGASGKQMTLDEIPFWYEGAADFTHRIIYYESSRGCPFSCSYCLSSIEKAMDFRSVARVCRELDFFLERRVPQVKFVDRTFNCKKAHALPILRHILEHDNGVTNFHFEVAADLLDEDYFVLLQRMRPGAIQLEIGVQSTNPDTVAQIRRTMDFSKVAAAVSRIQSWRNIHIHLDLIAGLPKEGLRSFQSSFNAVYELRHEPLQLGFLKVLKGSAMESEAPSYGLLYTNEPPYEVLATKWLSFEDVCRLKMVEEVLERYYNSGQFSHTLDFLSAYFHTPYAMYDALASWYDSRGLFGIQPSRIRKYEILLEFAVSIITASKKSDAGPQADVCREYLAYDIYLREHMKNRPDFLPSLQSWKDAIHGILSQEAKTHALFPQLSHCGYRELTKTLHVEIFPTIFGQPAAGVFYYGARDPLTNNGIAITVPLQSRE